MRAQSLLTSFSIFQLFLISSLTLVSPGSCSLSTLLGAPQVTTNNAAKTKISSSQRPNIFETFVTPVSVQNWQDKFNQIQASLQNMRNSSVSGDAQLTAPELIVKYGYPFENHTIQTEDGYLLEYHRIPCGKNSSSCTGFRPPVLIQHGLFCESTNWLTQPESNVLPYQMANQGYDVWLGNARGNKYSRGHVNLTTSDPEYWRFSWHEMGIYDIPAAIDYILGETNATKINYAGHSMGTTMFFVMGSEKPEYMDKITFMVGYGPVSYNQYTGLPTHSLAPVLGVPGVQDALLAAGQGEFLPEDITKYIKQSWTPLCTPQFVDQISCAAIIFTIMGFDYKQIDYNYFPICIANLPSSTSTMAMLHYFQGMLHPVITPTFRQFDYGPINNLSKYSTLNLNSTVPPSYNFTSIDCPKHLFTGPNDIQATPYDVENTKGKMPNTNYTLVDFPEWNHMDFLWGVNATFYCHDPAISLFNAANGL